MSDLVGETEIVGFLMQRLKYIFSGHEVNTSSNFFPVKDRLKVSE